MRVSKRSLLRGAAGAVAVGLGLTAALVHFGRKWIMPPRVVLDPPQGDACEEVHFAAADGTPLYGWFLPAGPGRPGLVLCHGYQRALEETFPLGCDLRAQGFNVLLFDFRGCGRSGGRFTTIGYEEPRDALAAVRWLQERLGAETPIGLLGISMGGAVALTVAAECPAVRAVVADSAFATLAGAVAHYLRALRPPLRALYYLAMRGAEWQCRVRVAWIRPVEAARRLGDRPVLLIHGTADDVVPYAHARELLAALPGPCELWTLDGVPHAMARFHAREEYLARVTAFFARHLAPASPVLG